MKRVIAPSNWKDGKLEIVDRPRMINDLHAIFGTFPTICDIIVQRVGRTRSSRQNKYLWAIPYKMIADHTGHEPEEIHDFYKAKFLKRILNIFDEEIEYTLSTRKLTTVEFEEYTESIRRDAAVKFGLDIPLPNENQLSNEGDED